MKITKWLMMAMCGMFIASCSDSKDDPGKLIELDTGGGVKSFSSFTATIGDKDVTRAYLDGTSQAAEKRVFWSENDVILVYSDTQREPKKFELTSITENVAVFNGPEISGNKFFALYPEAIWSPDSPNSDNPNIVKAKVTYEDTFIPSNGNGYRFEHPMVATSISNNLVFKQTMGMIHVSIGYIYQISKVALRGNNGEKLVGVGEIDLSDPNPVFKIIDDSWSDTVTYAEFDNNTNHEGIIDDLDPLLGVTTRGQSDTGDSAGLNNILSDDNIKDIYFTIPPMTFEKGFSLEIFGYDKDGKEISFTKSTDSKVAIDRAAIAHYTLVDVDAELEEQSILVVLDLDPSAGLISLEGVTIEGDALASSGYDLVNNLDEIINFTIDVSDLHLPYGAVVASDNSNPIPKIANWALDTYGNNPYEGYGTFKGTFVISCPAKSKVTKLTIIPQMKKMVVTNGYNIEEIINVVEQYSFELTFSSSADDTTSCFLAIIEGLYDKEGNLDWDGTENTDEEKQSGIEGLVDKDENLNWDN